MRGWVACLAGLVVATSAGSALVITREAPRVVAGDAPPTTTAPSTSTTAAPLTDAGQATTTTPTNTTVAELPPCTPSEAVVEADPLAQWATIVLDPGQGLPSDFEPPDLTAFNPPDVEGEITIREIVVPDLTAMLTAARDDGTPLSLVSGYRSYSRQEYLYEQEVAELGEEAASATTARPGHSEHQLGTAIDLLAPGVESLTPGFADTPAGMWLAENIHRYGFVLSYPRDNRDRSCYEFEPWHIRYVGRDLAQQIHDSGLSPREWLFTHPG